MLADLPTSGGMLIVINILYIAFLFGIFLCGLFLPIGLIIWAIRRWYATHRLADLPWRRRRVLRGLALVWTATFARLVWWKKITGITVLLSLLLAAFLYWLNAALYCDSPENGIIWNLQIARYSWLRDNCPRPIDPDTYLGGRGYVYTNSLVIKDPDWAKRSLGMFQESTYTGLFATSDNQWPRTYVIATTGEILVLEGSKIRLLRKQ